MARLTAAAAQRARDERLEALWTAAGEMTPCAAEQAWLVTFCALAGRDAGYLRRRARAIARLGHPVGEVPLGLDLSISGPTQSVDTDG